MSEEEKTTGTSEDYFYWGRYGNQRNFRPRQWAFSLVRTSGDEWLFISAAKIIDTPADSRATVQVFEKYAPLFGMLIIRCKKGNKNARYTFNLSKYLDLAIVKEALLCV